MGYVAVSKEGQEFVSESELIRGKYWWKLLKGAGTDIIFLPKGSIKKLIGKDLTWDDEPVKLA